MDRQNYPALAASKIIHLDASAAFPLHSSVIEVVNDSMQSLLGAPGKAQYDSAADVTKLVEQMRQHVAAFINAEPEEIFIVASASDAARRLADLWGNQASVLYSPEDHSRIVYELSHKAKTLIPIGYKLDGEYNYDAMVGTDAQVAVLSDLHHIYGSDNDIPRIRKQLPGAKLIVDSSQSVSRQIINVQQMECDALFFSSQKIGGIAGVGILFIAKKHHSSMNLENLEPNTIPVVPLVSLDAAIRVIETEGIATINQHLAKLTAYLIGELTVIPTVEFSKGPAFPSDVCYGQGIVSFSIDGYTSQDIAMILQDNNIQVRAGDHCVDPDHVDQDVVRISMHRYTSKNDLKSLIDIVSGL